MQQIKKFDIVYVGDEYYKIKAKHSNKVITIESESPEFGSKIKQQEDKNLDTQKWIIKKSSEGVFYIVSKWNYIKLIDLAIDGITSFTTSPLRIFIIKDIIQAYQAIILLILFFSGVQILLFGIVGEYLGRIFNETKNRPLYLVNEYNDNKEMNDSKL